LQILTYSLYIVVRRLHSIQRTDFLFDFNRNYAPIFCRFRVIASYLSKVANVNLPHLHLAHHWVTLFDFRGDLWRQKTTSRKRYYYYYSPYR